MANMLEGGGKTPVLPPAALQAMGFKVHCVALCCAALCWGTCVVLLRAVLCVCHAMVCWPNLTGNSDVVVRFSTHRLRPANVEAGFLVRALLLRLPRWTHRTAWPHPHR